MTETEPQHLRAIRSFVVRSGRMTQAQQKSFDKCWFEKGLALEAGLINKQQVFGRDAPLVLEIGFGMGGSLVQMAKEAPEKNFIGIEVHRAGVGKLFQTMEEERVENIRVYCSDAVEVVRDCITDNSLSRIQIFFPDPWHKKKHHKRRMIQSPFIQVLRSKLTIGGVIHLATDWEHYAEQMMEVMMLSEGFSNVSEEYCFSPRPDYRPVTKFENRGNQLGHGVWDLLFEKTS